MSETMISLTIILSAPRGTTMNERDPFPFSANPGGLIDQL